MENIECGRSHKDRGVGRGEAPRTIQNECCRNYKDGGAKLRSSARTMQNMARAMKIEGLDEESRPSQNIMSQQL